MSHRITEEIWRYTDGTRTIEQYPIRWAKDGTTLSVQVDANSWTSYPPSPGWVRLSPTPWDPSTTPVDPDPPTMP